MRTSMGGYVEKKIGTLGPDVVEELEAIRTAVYKGDKTRNPEEDVRFLLGLVHELARA